MDKGNDSGPSNVRLSPPNSENAQASDALQVTKQSYLQSWRLAIVTFSLCLGTFLMALDINIIGVAVPKITTVFNSLDDVSWYASAYLLTVTAFQPTMGYLYKSFSIRMIYFSNIIIFEVGSIICAAAPNSPAFICGRAFAGLGAAGLLQGALAIITHIVELERRPVFMAIVISVFGLSVCIGPVMGGAFTDNVSWRWCFWINLPIGGLALLILVFFLRLNNTEQEPVSFAIKLSRMDLTGTILFIGATCCLVLALQWGGQTMPWNTSIIIGLFVGFGILTVLFAFVQYRRGENALTPIRVLRQRSILASSMFLFFIGMFNNTYSFYLPFYFQAVQDVLPIISGVRIIPFVLAQMSFIGLTGFLASRWGHYVPYMILGMIICAIGAGLVTRLDINTPTTQWAAFLVIAGIGLGTAMQLPYTAVQIVLSEADVPIGNALLVFFNQLGSMVSIPIAQSLFLSSLREQVSKLLPSINPTLVIAAGAANLDAIAAGSQQALFALRQCYAIALYRPYVLALAAACAATVCVGGMEWKNLKVEGRRRKELTEQKEEHGGTVETGGIVETAKVLDQERSLGEDKDVEK